MYLNIFGRDFVDWVFRAIPLFHEICLTFKHLANYGYSKKGRDQKEKKRDYITTYKFVKL